MRTRGWLTIFTGPPASGKSNETRRLMTVESYKPFVVVQGHSETKTMSEIIDLIFDGNDVIFETTLSVKEFPPVLLAYADTIEVFKKE